MNINVLKNVFLKKNKMLVKRCFIKAVDKAKRNSPGDSFFILEGWKPITLVVKFQITGVSDIEIKTRHSIFLNELINSNFISNDVKSRLVYMAAKSKESHFKIEGFFL